jgi:deoxyxylulose-5-phosphate synthase
VLSGGMGSSILEFYNKDSIAANVEIFAYDDKFITHGEVEELHRFKEMDHESIAKKIEAALKQ